MLRFVKDYRGNRPRAMLTMVEAGIKYPHLLRLGRLGLLAALGNLFGFPIHERGGELIDARGAPLPKTRDWNLIRAAMINAETPLIDWSENPMTRSGAQLVRGDPPMLKLGGHIIEGEWGEFGGEWVEWGAVRNLWPRPGRGRVLHVGSGAGVSAAILKMLGYETHCVDTHRSTALLDGEPACDEMIIKEFHSLRDASMIDDYDLLVMDCEGCEWGLPHPRIPHLIEIHHNAAMLTAYLGRGDIIIYVPDEGVHLVMGWGRK